MTQYQLIFRHLFELKYVERQLVGVWQLLQPTRGLFRYVTHHIKSKQNETEERIHLPVHVEKLWACGATIISPSPGCNDSTYIAPAFQPGRP